MSQILIVDDEADTRAALREVLSLEGYEVITAADGREGLQIAASEHPDLIISDVMMPQVSGFEMCRRLRHDSATSDIPIILSSFIDPARPLEQNWDIFLRKPVDSSVLLAQVEHLLAET